MPKYKVTMNYVAAYCTEFVVEAKDPDLLHDLIGEIDMDKIEKATEWVVCDYQPPEINDFEKVHKDTPVNPKVQKLMEKIGKAWEAL